MYYFICCKDAGSFKDAITRSFYKEDLIIFLAVSFVRAELRALHGGRAGRKGWDRACLQLGNLFCIKVDSIEAVVFCLFS